MLQFLLVFAPLFYRGAVLTVLSMALAGAKGNTAIQLKNTLQLTNFTDEKIYATVGNLVQSVKVY